MIDWSSLIKTEILKAEEREERERGISITINQIKMMMREIHRLCEDQSFDWKNKFIGQIILPHTATLYDNLSMIMIPDTILLLNN